MGKISLIRVRRMNQKKQNPQKRQKKSKKKEVKVETPVIYDYDEDRVDLLMKEHKAKKEKEAMMDETSDLEEETKENNYITNLNNLSVKEEKEPTVKRNNRDSTYLRETEELFEAIDPNASMDEELEAMLKWQEEQEEQERIEEKNRKERLAEKQRKLEEEVEEEKRKREEEKKKEDEDWNKKIQERKRKISDLKNQEEERERKMAEE